MTRRFPFCKAMRRLHVWDASEQAHHLQIGLPPFLFDAIFLSTVTERPEPGVSFDGWSRRVGAGVELSEYTVSTSPKFPTPP